MGSTLHEAHLLHLLHVRHVGSPLRSHGLLRRHAPCRIHLLLSLCLLLLCLGLHLLRLLLSLCLLVLLLVLLLVGGCRSPGAGGLARVTHARGGLQQGKRRGQRTARAIV